MRPIRKGVPKARLILALAPLALAGCVSGDYLYDYPQGGYYYGSGAGYSSSYYSGYYSDYYGYPGHYRDYYYRPRSVYYDHDHDPYDCRHESHRDRRPYDDRNRDDRDRDYRDRGDRDRDGKDGNGAGPSPHRLPPPDAAPVRRTPRAAPPRETGPPPPKAAARPPEVESDRTGKHRPGERRR